MEADGQGGDEGNEGGQDRTIILNATGRKDPEYTPNGLDRSTLRGRGGKQAKVTKSYLLVWFLL